MTIPTERVSDNNIMKSCLSRHPFEKVSVRNLHRVGVSMGHGAGATLACVAGLGWVLHAASFAVVIQPFDQDVYEKAGVHIACH